MKPPRLRASARALFLLPLLLAALPAVHAGSVTASGDVSPFPDPNPFSDPMWETFGPLTIGVNGTGSIIVDGISPMMDAGDITLGANAGGSGTLSVINGGKISLPGGGVSVGKFGSGNLTIDGAGSQIQNGYSYIGYNAGGSGTATIANGGKWKTFQLYVATAGTGSLTVTNGGTVEVTSTLLLPSLTHLSGDGVITTHGLVYGGDLVFDSTHGSSQTIAFGNGGQLQLNQNSSGDLGVGYQSATGNLTIAEGVSVYASSSELGMAQNSVIQAVVKDAGTLWDVRQGLSLGSASLSSATLDITHGGRVNADSGNIASGAGSSGTVTIDGTNSTWDIADALTVGGGGTGTLHVSNGGSLQVGGVLLVNPQGTLNVGAGSAATANGDIFNKGNLLVNGDVYVNGPYQNAVVTPSGSVAGTGTLHGDLRYQIGGNYSLNPGTSLTVSGGIFLHSDFDAPSTLTIAAGSTITAGSITSLGDLVLNGDVISDVIIQDQRSPLSIGTFAGDGNITGNLTSKGAARLYVYDNNSLTVSGTVAVENQSGSLTVATGGALTAGQGINNSGALLVDGDAFSDVTISGGASLAGDGSITGNLSFLSGAMFTFDSTSTLDVTGAVSFASGFGIDNLIGLDANTPEGIYTLIDTTSTDFSLAGLDNWGIANIYQLSDIGDPYKGAYFQQGSLQVVVIPEPSTALLTALGMGVLFLEQRRRRREGKVLIFPIPSERVGGRSVVAHRVLVGVEDLPTFAGQRAG